MKWKKYFICSLVLLPALFSFIFSSSANALSTTSAQIQFWSSSSGNNISAEVTLPWTADIGGSSSSRGSFYLNRAAVYYALGDISDTATAISGRAVLRLSPAQYADSSVKTYICDKEISSMVASNVSTQCSSPMTFWYSDGSTSIHTFPVYFIADAVNQIAVIYVDYNYNLPNKKLVAVSFVLEKTGNFDVFSIQNAWGRVVTLSSNELTYFITDPNASSNEQLSNLVNQNQTMISQNNQIISELQNQSDQQQQQYDQEKQEEAEREEEQKAQEEEMASLFAFSIANPLTPFFALFGTGGDCASIPTIAGMVGSDNTQYCPWFSATTRNILTPVIGLSASMLLFGFVMSWLRSTRDTGVAV